MDITNRRLAAVLAVNIAVAGVIIKRKINARNRRGRPWSRLWLEKRRGNGVLGMLNVELQLEDPTAYRNFLRLTTTQFVYLLSLVSNDIVKLNTFMREPVSAQHRLQVTLRFLATGESYRSLMYATRIHESTISRFIPEVCAAIYNNLKREYLQTPKTSEGWEKIAEDFYNLWQFPNCLGALDDRHISFRAPASAGSYYYNYKGFHSIVLLAMYDARYRFTYVNVGINGRISDGDVFQQSLLQTALNDPNNPLNFPPDKELSGQKCKVPFVIVADDAFPLSKHLMKPYPSRGLTEDCKIFNYRLSRARRMIESSFGLLANRFRVLLNPINLSPEKVEIITLACVVLHNYLVTNNNEKSADLISEESHATSDNLMPLGRQGSNNSPLEARLIRNEFKNFFNTSGAVPWQQEAIRSNNL